MTSARRILASTVLALCMSLALAPAAAQPALLVKPLAERRVAELPAGALYWRIETVADRAQAESAAGAWSLVAESAGRTWLFTLGAAGEATRGATKVAEVGPIPRVQASRYLLRINDASGPPGSVTSVHSHPGSEAFFVAPEDLEREEPELYRLLAEFFRQDPARDKRNGGREAPVDAKRSDG